MTITVSPARNEYTSNAGQTVFNYTFKIFDTTDLNVYVTPAGQECSDSDLTTAYNVDISTIGDPAGGFITFNTPLNEGDLVTIVSAVPSSRTTDYQNNGDFRPEIVNNDFDRVVSIVKKIEDKVSRSPALPECFQGDKPLSLPIPESGKSLIWNGEKYVNYTPLNALPSVPEDKIIGNFTNYDMKKISDAKIGLTSGGFIVDLVVGDRVSTQGYHFPNDGGGSDYIVVSGGTGLEDGGSYINLNNGLQLQLLPNMELLSVKQFGAVGDGVADDTIPLDNFVAFFNSSKINKMIGKNKDIYNYNGAGMKLASNKVSDGNGATLTTMSGSLCLLTQGTYNNPSENIHFRNWIVEGFNDQIMLLFANNSSIMFCRCYDAGNIGIQVKGDDLVGNVIAYNHVKNPTFHCYATNDSINFNPANIAQGYRYPRDTLFFNNVAEGANQMAYDVHANSRQGRTRVIGGLVKNCDQLGKNTFGNMLWDGVTVVKDAGSVGATWFVQLGSNVAESPDSFCQMKNMNFEFDKNELLFLFVGSAEFSNNVVTTKGTARPVYFQMNASTALERTIRIVDNIFNGVEQTINSSSFMIDNSEGGSFSLLEFSNNKVNNVTTFDNDTRQMFDFQDSELKELKIQDNYFNIKSGAPQARIVSFTNTVVNLVRLDNNNASNVIKLFKAQGSVDINILTRRNNLKLAQDNFYFTLIGNLYSEGNSESDQVIIATGNTSGTAKVLIKNFANGGEYEVEISTDLSNSTGTFDTRVKYGLIVSRNGSSISSGVLYSIGNENNISANFAINGSNIEFWTNTATTHYVKVTKVGDR